MKTPPRVLGLALALSLALPLTGCGSMLERSYASVTPHTQFYDESAITSTLGAENYQGLVSALLHLVEEGEETGVIRLYQYSSVTGSAASDVDQACQEATREDPLGPTPWITSATTSSRPRPTMRWTSPSPIGWRRRSCPR